MLLAVLFYILFPVSPGWSSDGTDEERVIQELGKIVIYASSVEQKNEALALLLYDKALSPIDELLKDDPADPIAARIRKGEIMIGSYTYRELKEVVIPRIEGNAKNLQDIFSCALLLTRMRFHDYEIVQSMVGGQYARLGRISDATAVIDIIPVDVIGDFVRGDIVKYYIEKNDIGNALSVTNSFSHREDEIEVLGKIAVYQEKADDREKATQTLAAATAILDEMEEGEWKTILQESLADIFLNKGLCDKAFILSERIKDHEKKEIIYGDIADEYAREGSHEKAFDIIDSIAGEDKRARALNNMIPFLHRIENLEKVYERACKLRAGKDKNGLILALAIRYFDLGQDRVDLVDRALEDSRAIEGSSEKTAALSSIAETYVLLGHYDEAFSLLENHLQEDILAKIAVALTHRGDNAKAISLVEKMPHWDYTKVWTLVNMAEELQKAGRRKEAAEILFRAEKGALSPENASNRDTLLEYMISMAFMKIDDIDSACRAVEEIVDKRRRSYSLANLAEECARKEFLERALEITGKIEVNNFFEPNRDRSLSVIALEYAKKGQFEKSLQAVAMMGLLESRGRALPEIGYYFESMGKQTITPEIESILKKILENPESEKYSK